LPGLWTHHNLWQKKENTLPFQELAVLYHQLIHRFGV
ncbi:hypothetical protein T01_3071, partial [Trichinella spiralis]